MTSEAKEPKVDRGQLIYAMAQIDKQLDNLDKVLSLPRMKEMRAASTMLQRVRSNLRATMETIHCAMKPETKKATAEELFARVERELADAETINLR